MTTHVYRRNLREFDSKRFVSKLVHDSKDARVALFCVVVAVIVPRLA